MQETDRAPKAGRRAGDTGQKAVARIRGIVESVAARHIHNVDGITLAPPSPNHLVELAPTAIPARLLNADTTAGGDVVKALRAYLRPLVAGTGLSAGITGPVAQQLDSQQSTSRADEIVLVATLVLILVLLLAIFRGLVIALLPLILIAPVSQLATGLIADLNQAAHLGAENSISTVLIVVRRLRGPGAGRGLLSSDSGCIGLADGEVVRGFGKVGRSAGGRCELAQAPHRCGARLGACLRLGAARLSCPGERRPARPVPDIPIQLPRGRHGTLRSAAEDDALGVKPSNINRKVVLRCPARLRRARRAAASCR